MSLKGDKKQEVLRNQDSEDEFIKKDLYFVFFVNNDGFRIHKLFTFWRKGFDHTFVIKYCPDNKCYILFEWAMNKMLLKNISKKEADYLIDYYNNDGGSCILIKREEKSSFQISIPYCVFSVSHLLGISGIIITPYQLYKRLIREGGIKVF